jgi:crossover junction endodeoxyribonuclease RusA
MRSFAVFVPGAAHPQGSKRHVGNGRMVEASAGLGDWRTAVAATVRAAMNHTHHPGYPRGDALHVHVRFVMRRGATVRRAEPTTRPDVDKLARAILDALTTAGLLDDDAQVVRLVATKSYGDRPGVHVLVTGRPT